MLLYLVQQKNLLPMTLQKFSSIRANDPSSNDNDVEMAHYKN